MMTQVSERPIKAHGILRGGRTHGRDLLLVDCFVAVHAVYPG